MTYGEGATEPKRATIEDVAKVAGVSVATVSRALRDLPNVAPSTRDRVCQVATDLSYVADPAASRLAAGRTSTIAVAVPIFESWYFSTVVSGIEAVAKEKNVDLLLYAIANETERQRFIAGRGAWWRRGDALVMVDIQLGELEAQRLRDESARIVTIGTRTSRFASVTLREHDAGREAIRHLTGLGHRKIALITGDRHALDFRVPMMRRDGARAGLEEAGIDGPSVERPGGFGVEGGREAMAELLDLADPPTAVFCLSDEMAMGALEEIRRRGMTAPEDISIIGFDNHQMAEIFGLTTIAQNPDQIGALAGRLVLQRLIGRGADDYEPEHLIAETGLIVRRTTGPVPARQS